MIDTQSLRQNRRKFLSFLAASPLLQGQVSSDVIGDPKEAINVFDFEAAARKILPPAHWGYLATGVDDDGTILRAAGSKSKTLIASFGSPITSEETCPCKSGLAARNDRNFRRF